MNEEGVEISTNGTVVWVNSPEGCIGRFGPNGIEVRPNQPDLVPATMNRPDWGLFKNWMYAIHGVIVPDTYRPLAKGEVDERGSTEAQGVLPEVGRGSSST